MKALVFRAPGDYSVEEVPIPEVEPQGFLLKVHACSLCGTDLRTLRSGHRLVKPPWILGHELSGTVYSLGSEFTGSLRVGDKVAVSPPVYCGECEYCISGKFDLCDNLREIAVYWPGGFADFIAIPKEAIPLSIRHLPESMDFSHAAVCEPISACINAQEKGNIGLGETVLIIGAGPVGCIHTSIARERGAHKIIIADISTDRLNVVKAFQPDIVIDSSEKDLVEEVRKFTNGKGADVVITANPVPNTQVQAVELCKKGGRVLIFGGLPINNTKPGIDMNIVHYQGLHIIGTTAFAPKHHQLAIQLVNDNRIPVESFITKFKLSDFKVGAQLALDGKITKGVFLPD